MADNPKTTNVRSFWARVEEAEREVRDWPAWKRAAAERVYMNPAREDRASQREQVRIKPVRK